MSATVTARTITALMSGDDSSRTLLDLLTTEKMDGSDSTISANTVTATVAATSVTGTRSDGVQGRWSTVRQRLGLKSIICCGGGWAHQNPNNRSSSSALLPAGYESESEPAAASEGVNLATALAEERQFRQLTAMPLSELESTGRSSMAGTPASSKVSLMRLMAEAAMEADGEEADGEKSGCCCVCMERKKGAAFIPCGHTFCRVCSREVWLDRGSCPLCNRPIVDVLDIF